MDNSHFNKCIADRDFPGGPALPMQGPQVQSLVQEPDPICHN